MLTQKELQDRRNRCVCKCCGHALEWRMVIFNQYGGQGVELYCPKCEKIEFGIEPEIFNLAQKFVEEYDFNYYVEMEEGSFSRGMNVSKVGQILGWSLKEIGVLTENGLVDKKIEWETVSDNKID